MLDTLQEQEKTLSKLYKGRVPPDLSERLQQDQNRVKAAMEKNRKDFETALPATLSAVISRSVSRLPGQLRLPGVRGHGSALAQRRAGPDFRGRDPRSGRAARRIAG